MNREKVRKTERGGGFLSSRERRLAGQGKEPLRFDPSSLQILHYYCITMFPADIGIFA